MVLEKDRVARSQVDLGHRHDLALHLTGAGAEMNLGHVADPRSLPPSGLAHQVAYVEWRSTGAARQRGLLVHPLAPLALDTLELRCRDGAVGHLDSPAIVPDSCVLLVQKLLQSATKCGAGWQPLGGHQPKAPHAAGAWAHSESASQPPLSRHRPRARHSD